MDGPENGGWNADINGSSLLFLCQDIGRTTKGPEVNKDTSEVSITYSSSTPCTDDPAQNYTSTIIFSCQRGTDLVCRR